MQVKDVMTQKPAVVRSDTLLQEVAETMGITRRRVRTLENDVQSGLKRFLGQRARR